MISHLIVFQFVDSDNATNWNPKRVGYGGPKDAFDDRTTQFCVANSLKVWYWIYWKIKILSRKIENHWPQDWPFGSRSIKVDSLYVATWWDHELVCSWSTSSWTIYKRHNCRSSFWADTKMPPTKNIERQMGSVGDPISQKNATSGFTWDRIPSKTQ